MKKTIKWMCIILIGLAILGAVTGNSSSGSQSASSDAPVATTQTTDATEAPATAEPTDVPTAAPTEVPVLRVGITTLFGPYDANKVTASAYYKGRTLQVSGVATNISQDILGTYFVALGPGGDTFTMDQVACYVSGPDALAGLTNGHSVTVRGTVDDMSLGIIPLKDCQVMP